MPSWGRSAGAALLLMLPAAVPYLAHFGAWKPYSIPTGYIQEDMPVYMAKARECFDDGRVHLFYGNPSDGLADSPRIYFQPWTFALGLAHHASGLRPGIVFAGFWFLAAWLASWAILALFREVHGLEARSKRVGLVLFAWGGGLFAIDGAIAGAWQGGRISWDGLFAYDPAQGWWFLNLGRNLVYPTEALYHALTLGCLLCVVRGRLILALGVAAILAASSPFAGSGLLATLAVWIIVEACSGRDRGPGVWFRVGVMALLGAFLGYYVVYMSYFESHWRLARQMSLDWTLPAIAVVLAGGIVAPWRSSDA